MAFLPRGRLSLIPAARSSSGKARRSSLSSRSGQLLRPSRELDPATFHSAQMRAAHLMIAA
jgi:hypothetical protein